MSLRRLVKHSGQELAQRARTNPYMARLGEKPGRIFQFNDFEPDRLAVCKLLTPGVPTYCELGCGSGNHLIARAKIAPNAIFFGVELRYKRVFRTIEKAERANVGNLFTLKTNAVDVPLIFPEQSLTGVYVNFPDPWEKNRSKKHRILRGEFLTALRPLLQTESAPNGTTAGFISFKTDHQEYFETVLKLLDSRTDYRVLRQSFDLHKSQYVEGNVRSEFEDLFLSQGKPVYFCEFVAQ